MQRCKHHAIPVSTFSERRAQSASSRSAGLCSSSRMSKYHSTAPVALESCRLDVNIELTKARKHQTQQRANTTDSGWDVNTHVPTRLLLLMFSFARLFTVPISDGIVPPIELAYSDLHKYCCECRRNECIMMIAKLRRKYVQGLQRRHKYRESPGKSVVVKVEKLQRCQLCNLFRNPAQRRKKTTCSLS